MALKDHNSLEYGYSDCFPGKPAKYRFGSLGCAVPGTFSMRESVDCLLLERVLEVTVQDA